ncbi:MAG: AAA family ATPase [Calothrix sp. MO_167.B12]|nr:AAA family ATPase [Calothrix sp. MO_167.B12]
MLRDLSIHNYRSFKEFHVDGLARVNLMVGSNNSGKTSLLEAICLLVNQNNPQALIELLDNRGEIALAKVSKLSRNNQILSRSYQIKHLFSNHQLSYNQNLEFKSEQELPLSLKIYLSPINNQEGQLNLSEDIAEDDIPGFELNFVYNSHESIRVPILDDGTFEMRFMRRVKSPKSALYFANVFCQFITTDNINFQKLAELWDAINLTPKEDEVIRALQIIEPDVKRLSFTSRQTSNSGIIIKMRGQSEPIPLGSMGDGMRRILTLVMCAVNVENGFLLVDEIDTGLYYEIQTDMWRFIFETAKRLNIQVFATTHSWDCVRAFQEALESVEDSNIGKLFRLDSKYGEIRAVEYSSEELKIALKQDIEVR